MRSSRRIKLIVALYAMAITWFVALAATAFSVADAGSSTLMLSVSPLVTTVATMALAILAATVVAAGTWMVFKRLPRRTAVVATHD